MRVRLARSEVMMASARWIWIGAAGTAVWLCLLAASCGKSDAPGASAPATPPAEQIDPTLARMRQLKEAAKRVQEEREKRRNELRASGDVKLTDKKLIGTKKGSQKIELEFSFENKTDKAMSQAEGTIVISDSSGKSLRKMKVPFTEGVEAHKTATKRGKFPLDEGSEEDHAFVKIPLKELQTEWIPTFYKYADGTQQQGE